MYAVVIDRPGGPEVLTWQDVPEVMPGPTEVVIEVTAAGVNRADVMQRRGLYPPPPGAPEYPGLECAGRIVEVGPAVDGWQVGDAVCALLPGGGYAERVAVEASLLLPIPDGVSVVEAAGLVEVAATVYSNLVDFAGLGRGDTVLVHGGSGGIGTFAIQWATAVGATVYTTARRENADLLRRLGASAVIDYREDDFSAEIARLTTGEGVDVILDHIGGSYLDRNVNSLAKDGRLAVIGLQGGRRTELDLSALMARRGRITVTGLRSRPLAQRAAVLAGVRRNMWPLVESGAIRPIVAQRFAMADAADAHTMMDKGGYVGKIILTV